MLAQMCRESQAHRVDYCEPLSARLTTPFPAGAEVRTTVAMPPSSVDANRREIASAACELVADGVHLHDGTLAYVAATAGPDRKWTAVDAFCARLRRAYLHGC